MFRIHFQVLRYVLGQNTEMVEEEQKHPPVLPIQEDKQGVEIRECVLSLSQQGNKKQYTWDHFCNNLVASLRLCEFLDNNYFILLFLCDKQQ